MTAAALVYGGLIVGGLAVAVIASVIVQATRECWDCVMGEDDQ